MTEPKTAKDALPKVIPRLANPDKRRDFDEINQCLDYLRAQPEQAPVLDAAVERMMEPFGNINVSQPPAVASGETPDTVHKASDIAGLREAIAEKVLYEDALQYLYDFTGSKPIGSTEYQIHMYIYSIFQSAEKGEFND